MLPSKCYYIFLNIFVLFELLRNECNAAKIVSNEDQPREACQSNKIRLEVSEAYVISMAKFYVEDGDLKNVIAFVGWPDSNPTEECIMKKHEDASGKSQYRLTIASPFDACGTVASITSSYTTKNKYVDDVHFKNTIWWKISSTSTQDMLPFQVYSFQCVYRDQNHIRSSVNPRCCDPRSLNSSFGEVKLQMDYWKSFPGDDYMSRPFQLPFAYLENESIFVTVRALPMEAALFHLAVTECYVSSTYLYHVANDSVYIIQNSCPVWNSASRVEILQNGVSAESIFSYNVASPFNSTSYLYLHCRARLCKSGCRTDCKYARRLETTEEKPDRETLGNHEEYLSAIKGPIKVVLEKELNNKQFFPNVQLTTVPQGEDVGKSWMLPVLLAIVNCACVMLLGLLCYALARSAKSKRNRFRKLTGESLFGETSHFSINNSIAICEKEDCIFNSLSNMDGKSPKKISDGAAAPCNTPRLLRDADS